MRIAAKLKALALAATLIIAGHTSLLAQQAPKPEKDPAQNKGLLGKLFWQGKKEPPKNGKSSKNGKATDASASGPERLEPDEIRTLPSDVSAEAQANRHEQLSEEEAAVLPYYNNFLTTYRLGPEDIISVTVFGQDRYSRPAITVPPDGRISYPLIPEGIFVAGKTTQQVQDELTKKLDEYIIDPKVSVFLEKAMSARYSVMGDVAHPGIMPMGRRLSVYEALAEAGGVLPTGDKKKVTILRRRADGTMLAKQVDISAIEKGRAKEMEFLVPGDQVIVPGNTFKKVQSVLSLLPVLSFARIFTGGW